jgi:hypothetical protein
MYKAIDIDRENLTLLGVKFSDLTKLENKKHVHNYSQLHNNEKTCNLPYDKQLRSCLI